MDILNIQHLTKVYGKGDCATRALDDVTLSVPEGQFLAIVGSSGSGKSTLLHLMGGVDRPTSGSVYLAGNDVYSRNDEQLAVLRRREVGIVYQFFNLIPTLTVLENMTLPVALDGRPVNEGRLRELVKTLGLEGREDHLPSQLSGGQQQRVAIGRALMNSPAVLLADEPTGNIRRDHGHSARRQQAPGPDARGHHARRVHRPHRRPHRGCGRRPHRAR